MKGVGKDRIRDMIVREVDLAQKRLGETTMLTDVALTCDETLRTIKTDLQRDAVDDDRALVLRSEITDRLDRVDEVIADARGMGYAEVMFVVSLRNLQSLLLSYVREPS